MSRQELQDALNEMALLGPEAEARWMSHRELDDTDVIAVAHLVELGLKEAVLEAVAAEVSTEDVELLLNAAFRTAFQWGWNAGEISRANLARFAHRN